MPSAARRARSPARMTSRLRAPSSPCSPACGIEAGDRRSAATATPNRGSDAAVSRIVRSSRVGRQRARHFARAECAPWRARRAAARTRTSSRRRRRRRDARADRCGRASDSPAAANASLLIGAVAMAATRPASASSVARDDRVVGRAARRRRRSRPAGKRREIRRPCAGRTAPAGRRPITRGSRAALTAISGPMPDGSPDGDRDDGGRGSLSPECRRRPSPRRSSGWRCARARAARGSSAA